MKNDIWEKLYNEAKRVQNARVVSPFIEAGGVAAAILTKNGNIILGIVYFVKSISDVSNMLNEIYKNKSCLTEEKINNINKHLQKKS